MAGPREPSGPDRPADRSLPGGLAAGLGRIRLDAGETGGGYCLSMAPLWRATSRGHGIR
jgi:hypothetical protein